MDRARDACALARNLRGVVGMLKVGSRLFTAEGPSVVRQLAKLGFGIFLDLKYHDIPNTVSGAVAAAAMLPGVRIITLHALGGTEAMKAARVARGANRTPALLAVTILTSHDARSIKRVGIAGTPSTAALRLAQLAKSCGMDGIVASAEEVRAIREACGRQLRIVVPGIRPSRTATNDQSRVATPSEAIRAGADYLVIGRPITGARDPRRAANALNFEVISALPLTRVRLK
jgi:orotidine-5'-phosphate decarboxylase